MIIKTNSSDVKYTVIYIYCIYNLESCDKITI